MAGKADFRDRLDRIAPLAEPESEDGVGPVPAPKRTSHRDLGFWSTAKSILGDIFLDYAGPIVVAAFGGLVVLGVSVTFGIGFQTALIATFVIIAVLAVFALGNL